MLRRLTVLCLLLSASAVAEAVEPAAVQKPAGKTLGTPASAEAVTAALDAARTGGTAKAIEAARSLGAAGGHAAADGLLQLLKSREARVRTAALNGVVRVALRSDELALAVHRSLNSAETRPRSERLAAIKALGVIGDGGDMPLLLDLASASIEDPGIRSGAFRAMAALSGLKLPYVHARWSYWWKRQGERSGALLEKAIAALDDEPESEIADIYERVVSTNAWFDLAYTSRVLVRWLGHESRALRRIGCRLAAELRLADLVEPVEAVARRSGSGATRDAATAALTVLGHPHPDNRE